MKNTKSTSNHFTNPWGMSDGEKAVLKSYLKPHHTVLEWGTGESTLFIPPLVSSLVSIEHNGDWLDWHPEFGDVILSPLDGGEYVSCAAEFEEPFDIILVDGRMRVECAKFVHDHGLLAEGGILFVHDWARKKYHKILDFYEIVEVVAPIPANRGDKGLVALRRKKS